MQATPRRGRRTLPSRLRNEWLGCSRRTAWGQMRVSDTARGRRAEAAVLPRGRGGGEARRGPLGRWGGAQGPRVAMQSATSSKARAKGGGSSCAWLRATWCRGRSARTAPIRAAARAKTAGQQAAETEVPLRRAARTAPRRSRRRRAARAEQRRRSAGAHPSDHPPPPTDLMSWMPFPLLGAAAAPLARSSAAVAAAAKAR